MDLGELDITSVEDDVLDVSEAAGRKALTRKEHNMLFMVVRRKKAMSVLFAAIWD